VGPHETIDSTKEAVMQYALFVCADETQELSEEDVQERWKAFMRFQEDMETAARSSSSSDFSQLRQRRR
jgi:hypothetical protein